jgi:hypothetical protein
MRRRLLLACLLLTWSAASASGQISVNRGEPQRAGSHWEERADCSAPLRAGGKLTVRADQGSIRVMPGAGETMTCKILLRAYRTDEADARRMLKNYELSLRPQENGLVLRGVTGPAGSARRSTLSAEFEITVPTRSNLDLETRGGDIRVGALQGSLQAVTAGGDIQAADIKGAVRLETAGGSIRLGSVTGSVEARTAGGSIHVGDIGGPAVLETSGGEIVSGMVNGTLRAETAGGDLVLRGATGALEAQTAGGQIRIGESGGSVVAQTAGGSIRLNGARGRVDVKTAGGSIDLLQLRNGVQAMTAAGSILAQVDSDLKAFPASRLETSAGDIRVFLPAGLPLNIDAIIDSANGHKIVSDFPLHIQGEGPEAASTRLRGAGALNGGGEILRIRAVSGNIEIRRLDMQTLEKLRAAQETFWRRWREREERERLSVQRPQ